MIAQLLSTQSRKAWVAGVLMALLQPIVSLLSGTSVITLRAVLMALGSGVLAVIAVYATTNADVPVSTDPPVTPDPSPTTNPLPLVEVDTGRHAARS